MKGITHITGNKGTSTIRTLVFVAVACVVAWFLLSRQHPLDKPILNQAERMPEGLLQAPDTLIGKPTANVRSALPSLAMDLGQLPRPSVPGQIPDLPEVAILVESDRKKLDAMLADLQARFRQFEKARARAISEGTAARVAYKSVFIPAPTNERLDAYYAAATEKQSTVPEHSSLAAALRLETIRLLNKFTGDALVVRFTQPDGTIVYDVTHTNDASQGMPAGDGRFHFSGPSSVDTGGGPDGKGPRPNFERYGYLFDE